MHWKTNGLGLEDVNTCILLPEWYSCFDFQYCQHEYHIEFLLIVCILLEKRHDPQSQI
jgi:hypothetical protein